MILPIIKTFQEPYIVRNRREATLEELLTGNYHPQIGVETTVKVNVSNPFDAARYMAEVVEDNGLERFIDNFLNTSLECRKWQNAMPAITPEPLIHYKQYYPKFDTVAVDNCIKDIGVFPSVGQHLFRGGFWPEGSTTLVTDQPLSTSFCPQVALRNAEWRGKAYDEGKIDLFVINVVEPNTNIYFYNLNEELGNEKEVLFASGAKLQLVSRTFVGMHEVAKANLDYSTSKKTVPIHILEVDIS